jgi:hypothetical protein
MTAHLKLLQNRHAYIGNVFKVDVNAHIRMLVDGGQYAIACC